MTYQPKTILSGTPPQPPMPRCACRQTAQSDLLCCIVLLQQVRVLSIELGFWAVTNTVVHVGVWGLGLQLW